jgi:hypothetical protein
MKSTRRWTATPATWIVSSGKGRLVLIVTMTDELILRAARGLLQEKKGSSTRIEFDKYTRFIAGVENKRRRR